MEQTKKLQALATLADALNRRKVLWAVGGSLMLYFRGIVPYFHDLDVMVAAEDVEAALDCLNALGTQQPARPANPAFATPHFYEYTINGVEVDVLADFTIVKDGQAHRFPLTAQELDGFGEAGGESVPLQKLDTWRTCYALMGREDKLRAIDEKA